MQSATEEVKVRKGGCFGCKYSDPIYGLFQMKVKCEKTGEEIAEKYECDSRVDLFVKGSMFQLNKAG